MKKGSLHMSTITFPKNFQHNYTWKVKEWNHPEGSFFGHYLWSDGNNVYETTSIKHRVLKGNAWLDETPNIASNPGVHATNVWTDGSNIYWTDGYGDHRVLVNGTWKELTRLGHARGEYIWSNGNRVFYSQNGEHFERGIADHTVYSDWLSEVNWNISDFNGRDVWSDGVNVYLSYRNDDSVDKHYVLVGMHWEPKEWNISDFSANNIWTDGMNTYLRTSHVLKDGIWEPVEWKGLDVPYFFAGNIWSDGTNIYYSSYQTNYVLAPAVPVPQLNPAALMQGYMAARRNRK